LSIKSFTESAIILYKRNKYNEALSLACIAIDACSAKIYPNISQNSERYKKFLSDYFRVICTYGFPGIMADNIHIKVNAKIENLRLDDYGYVSMEQIIYHVLRCGLIHDCMIDETIQFTEETIIGDWNGDKFLIPKALIWGLIATIQECMRNYNE